MQNGNETSPSFIFAGQALLMKMFIALELNVIFCSNFVYYCILTLSNRWYAKQYEASSSIVFAGQALLVKMLKPLEPCGAFGSNFVYLCILTLSSHWYAKWGRGFTKLFFLPVKLFW